MASLKTLKIKTKSCKRILKELHSYEKEVEREVAKTAAMKEKGVDEYDLKQQILVIYISVRASIAGFSGPIVQLSAQVPAPCDWNEALEVIARGLAG